LNQKIIEKLSSERNQVIVVSKLKNEHKLALIIIIKLKNEKTIISLLRKPNSEQKLILIHTVVI
jgi:hypothetical protein